MKIIVTGATGMVGEGVLHQCLADTGITAVLSVSRRTAGITHPKLTELLLPDFFDLTKIQDRLSGYDACLFCLGVSSVGMKEAEFFKLAHELTLNFARALSEHNNQMVFCYISGTGTDSTEKGRLMWARVKGKTENDLLKLPFKAVYNFRPGAMKPMPGMKHTLKAYKYFGWLFPILKIVMPGKVSTLQQLADAMINAAKYGYEQNTVEVRDIKILAAR